MWLLEPQRKIRLSVARSGVTADGSVLDNQVFASGWLQGQEQQEPNDVVVYGWRAVGF
jgi:hypothetical protein